MPGSKPGEIVLYSEVTTSCSHRCDFCPIDHVERRGNISPDVQRGVLRLISSNPGRKFIVYPHLVGEPLLFAGLEEYLKTLAALPNVELWLCTNGVLLDAARLQALHESGLRNIWFSMFYATPADYQKYTHADRFDDARRNLYYLLAQSSRFNKIQLILFSQATAELEALIRDQSNVTLQVRRNVHPWKIEGWLYSRVLFRFLFMGMAKLRTKYVCVSIDGKVGFDWRNYNFRNSPGNICDPDPSKFMQQIDAGFIDVLKSKLNDRWKRIGTTHANHDLP